MQFEYEIGFEEYVAARHLSHRLSGRKRRVFRPALSFLTSFTFFLYAYSIRAARPMALLFVIIATIWLAAGLAYLLPVLSGRPALSSERAYRFSGVSGQRYRADVNEEGFRVESALRSWEVRWPAVRLKGEDDRIFLLRSGHTLFVFGKKYLDSDQQQELRRLCKFPQQP
jgi:hypothetical protein